MPGNFWGGKETCDVVQEALRTLVGDPLCEVSSLDWTGDRDLGNKVS